MATVQSTRHADPDSKKSKSKAQTTRSPGNNRSLTAHMSRNASTGSLAKRSGGASVSHIPHRPHQQQQQQHHYPSSGSFHQPPYGGGYYPPQHQQVSHNLGGGYVGNGYGGYDAKGYGGYGGGAFHQSFGNLPPLHAAPPPRASSMPLEPVNRQRRASIANPLMASSHMQQQQQQLWNQPPPQMLPPNNHTKKNSHNNNNNASGLRGRAAGTIRQSSQSRLILPGQPATSSSPTATNSSNSSSKSTNLKSLSQLPMEQTSGKTRRDKLSSYSVGGGQQGRKSKTTSNNKTSNSRTVSQNAATTTTAGAPPSPSPLMRRASISGPVAPGGYHQQQPWTTSNDPFATPKTPVPVHFSPMKNRPKLASVKQYLAPAPNLGGRSSVNTATTTTTTTTSSSSSSRASTKPASASSANNASSKRNSKSPRRSPVKRTVTASSTTSNNTNNNNTMTNNNNMTNNTSDHSRGLGSIAERDSMSPSPATQSKPSLQQPLPKTPSFRPKATLLTQNWPQTPDSADSSGPDISPATALRPALVQIRAATTGATTTTTPQSATSSSKRKARPHHRSLPSLPVAPSLGSFDSSSPASAPRSKVEASLRTLQRQSTSSSTLPEAPPPNVALVELDEEEDDDDDVNSDGEDYTASEDYTDTGDETERGTERTDDDDDDDDGDEEGDEDYTENDDEDEDDEEDDDDEDEDDDDDDADSDVPPPPEPSTPRKLSSDAVSVVQEDPATQAQAAQDQQELVNRLAGELLDYLTMLSTTPAPAPAPTPQPAPPKQVSAIYRYARACEWNGVLKELKVNPRDAKYVGEKDGTTALHLAVMSRTNPLMRDGKAGKYVSAPLSVVEALVKACPEAAIIRCAKKRYTPLAYACLVADPGYDMEDAADIVDTLLKFAPHSTFVFTDDGFSALDIHIVSYSQVHRQKDEVFSGGSSTTVVLRTLLASEPSLADARVYKNKIRGPVELLYRCNMQEFKDAVEEEVGELDDMKRRKRIQRFGSVVSVLSDWWAWKWSLILLKFSSISGGKEMLEFKAVQAASQLVGCPLPIFALAVNTFPNQVTDRDPRGDVFNLPIHEVCSWRADLENVAGDPFIAGRKLKAIQLLLEAYPDAARMTNNLGETALHLAVETCTPWHGGLELLVEACPKALKFPRKLRVTDKGLSLSVDDHVALGSVVSCDSDETDPLEFLENMYPFALAAVLGGVAEKRRRPPVSFSSEMTKEHDENLNRKSLQAVRIVYGLLRSRPDILEYQRVQATRDAEERERLKAERLDGDEEYTLEEYTVESESIYEEVVSD